MKAIYRVKNSSGNTAGFILNDNKYYSYYYILQNISYITNLKANKNHIITSNPKIAEISLAEVNKSQLLKLNKENSIEREIQSEFNEWYKSFKDMILYVSGARQVGKTTEILKFAYSTFENVIYIDLTDTNSKNLLEKALKSNNILFELIKYTHQLGLNEYEDNTNTVLIIDEIQESSEIYNSLRKIRKELNCCTIVTGSYLGRTLTPQYFKPAGDIYEIEMLPLSFKEFAKEFRHSKTLEAIDLYGWSTKEEYEALTKLYQIYIKIGGYPRVVKEYSQTKKLENCYKLLENLLITFTNESSSYFNNDEYNRSMSIFENVYKAALIVAAKEKKGTGAKTVEELTNFINTSSKEIVSRQEVTKAINWLRYSKILGSCNLYVNGDKLNIQYDRRFYFMDCGLMNYISTLTELDNATIQGLLAENLVYTELYRLYKGHKLKWDKPSYSIYSNYELDFMLVDKNDKTYGIEVKASNSNKFKSIKEYISKGLIDEAYVVEITKGGKSSKQPNLSKILIYTVGCRFHYWGAETQ